MVLRSEFFFNEIVYEKLKLFDPILYSVSIITWSSKKREFNNTLQSFIANSIDGIRLKLISTMQGERIEKLKFDKKGTFLILTLGFTEKERPIKKP